MPTLRSLARSARHAPGIERLDLFWNAVRAPYFAYARLRGGVVMDLGGYPVRVPMEFAQTGWDDYEREAMGGFVRWVADHPDGLVIDVGCAVGLYAHVALSVSPTVRAVAIDADLPSLAAVRRLTAQSGEGRLSLLHAFVGEKDDGGGGDFDDARLLTTARLARGEGVGEPRYAVAGSGTAPTYTLDSLFATRGVAVPTLIKIDIEGAELSALRGATRLLARRTVTLLLSVHSIHLARDFGHSVGAVRSFLAEHDYRAACLGVDHEEHWWATPAD